MCSASAWHAEALNKGVPSSCPPPRDGADGQEAGSDGERDVGFTAWLMGEVRPPQPAKRTVE